MTAASRANAQQADLEKAVKATYLYKLAPFVQWPVETNTDYAMTVDDSTTFNLCIAGRDPFRNLIDDAVQGLLIMDRPVIVRRMPVVRDGAGCHVMYISPESRQSPEEIIERVHGKPILTVTDGAGTQAATGIIDFVERDGNIRFRIDLAKAGESNLGISSKLLSLAVSVVPAVPVSEPLE